MSLLDKLIVLQLKGEGLQVSPRAKVLYINPRYKIGFDHNLDSVHSLVYFKINDDIMHSCNNRNI